MNRSQADSPPNHVTFVVSSEMTRLDVKNYLEKIYQVPVMNVRTINCTGEQTNVSVTTGEHLDDNFDFRRDASAPQVWLHLQRRRLQGGLREAGKNGVNSHGAQSSPVPSFQPKDYNFDFPDVVKAGEQEEKRQKSLDEVKDAEKVFQQATQSHKQPGRRGLPTFFGL